MPSACLPWLGGIWPGAEGAGPKIFGAEGTKNAEVGGAEGTQTLKFPKIDPKVATICPKSAQKGVNWQKCLEFLDFR